ncbi:MAG: methionine biosynthesis protein MetW [Planctomicrobium sp.]|jgi:methionine biosynthesis protein MetW|nr:methionine biosynthesis protein MetW [Planctomicrobium sp.]
MCAKRIHLPDPRAAVTNELIIDKITRGSRVIDLGCGDASLIARIRDQHDCDVFGVERDEELFVRGIEKGVPMLQADLNAGLMELPSQSFDFAILSQTLQQIDRPLDLLNEIFRVARRALVVVPNFAHWKIRLQVALRGRAPVTDHLPYEWYESPNVHFLSMVDFRELAEQGNFHILRELPIIGDRAVKKAAFANLRAHSALYVLERNFTETKSTPKPIQKETATTSV